MNTVFTSETRRGPVAVLLSGGLAASLGVCALALALTIYAHFLHTDGLPDSLGLEPPAGQVSPLTAITSSGLAAYADRAGSAQVRLSLPDNYYLYPFLEISLAEQPETVAFAIDVAADDSRRLLTQTMPANGRITLLVWGRTAWQDAARQLVLSFAIPPGSRVVIESVQLRQFALPVMAAHAAYAWRQTATWSLASPNFFSVTTHTPALLRPAVLTGAALVLGVACLALLGPVLPHRLTVRRGSAVALLLLWLLLDLRWQSQLTSSAAQSRDLYWHKTDAQKLLSGPERDLVRFAKDIREHVITDENPRIIVSSRGDYRGMRMAYHLYPLNVLWERNAPLRGPADLRVGDFLVLLPPSEMQLKSANGPLIYPDGRELAVLPLISGPSVFLFKVAANG